MKTQPNADRSPTSRALLCATILTALVAAGHATATDAAELETQTPGVYVILDGSGSMWGQLADGTHKITAAKDVVQGFSASDYVGRELAFRVYGHRREGDCSDSELVVPFSAPGEAISKMGAFADRVNPKGKTPIARSLRAALEDFGDRPGEIILVSDGIETCDEDPCALVREWSAGNVDIRVHVVGLGLEDKERSAMQCISEAAGTEYRDAQSADELAAGLQEIQQAAGDPGEPLNPDWLGLSIKATNEAGDTLRVYGTATWEGGDPLDVSSRGTHQVPPGDVEVTVGVRTRNGNLYKPVTRVIDVSAAGKTTLDVVVPEPPSVKARFVENGEDRQGAFVRGYQDGQEVLSFRSIDRAYIDPGTYSFRSQINKDNDLTVTETFTEGDHKEIVFALVATVHAKISFVADRGDHRFPSNSELWQNGELKYKVHGRNGVQALPGTYEARLPLRLTPYSHPGLVLTEEEQQEHVIEVPVGHVTIKYQKVDGSPGEDKRVFVTRKDANGKWVRDKINYAGRRIPLVAGEYRLEGWSQLGDFDLQLFNMEVGDDKALVLRAKAED